MGTIKEENPTVEVGAIKEENPTVEVGAIKNYVSCAFASAANFFRSSLYER